MNSHHVHSCQRNIYLSYKFFIYFLTIHFHNFLSNVWRAFESHCESQVLVFTKWCDDGTGVLIFVVKLKCIVLHTIVKFSEILVPRTLAQNVPDCWQWILLTFYDSVQLTWVADPAYSVVLLWEVNEDGTYSLYYCGAKTPSLTSWSNYFLKVFKWIRGTGWGIKCTVLVFGSMSMCTFLCG